MARKKYEGTATLPGMEEEQSATSRPRSRKVKSNDAGWSGASFGLATFGLSPARLIVLSTGIVLLLAISLYAFHLVEQFLIRDPRFALRGSASSAGAVTFDISGAEHASLNAIEAVFAEDVERSVYLVPVEDRLTTLRTVSWVRNATVARIWPNRLVVRVAEREPVAFVTTDDAQPALIDADGVILPRTSDDFDLPVLKGVDGTEPVEELRESVSRMLRLTGELGESVGEISEIDVSDRENIVISQSYDGRILQLMLGDRNYTERYRNFRQHYGDVRSRLPGASVLDLRLEDRITVVE